MRCGQLVSTATLLLAATVDVSARRSFQHVGKRDRPQRREAGPEPRKVVERYDSEPLFLNDKSKQFAVNGTNVPDVDFDLGESYAGLLPITSDEDDENKLYFWFFPSTNPAAEKEIVIWLNGGPGCSSLEGFLQENGPLIWQYGTYKPVKNPWSWHRLTNMVWIEQPVGTGFSTGTPTAENEEDIAKQFMGFWKNFVDTFEMQGYTVYITGESYAGQYCPYIASGFLDANDTEYYNMSGVIIYDPVLSYDEVQEPIPAVAFVDYWGGLFPFNDSFRQEIHARDASCNYTGWMNSYLQYPPPGPFPSKLPGTDEDGKTRDECWNIYEDIFSAILLLNPCFDIYQVATTCPLLWDVLGFPGSMEYLPEGASVYFDRDEVKKAINAPLGFKWESCSSDDVIVGGGDTSPPSALSVLPGVIERTNNVVIGHGALDMILLANGSLLAIQNMTWHGRQGFRSRPDEPFFVPAHADASASTLAGSGVFGTAHTERGLTYVGVDLAGHMVPQYAPTAAFRHLEFLLGRVASLTDKTPFTVDPDFPQPPGELGLGTAPQGWSDETGLRTQRRDGRRRLRRSYVE